MYSIDDIKVTLLNPNEVKDFIKNHGIVACVCYDTDEKYAERVGMSCLNEGHTSGSRGDYFKFEIECPRYIADQIVRHEQGVFKNMQSQRYVTQKEGISLYAPPKILKDATMYQKFKRYEITMNIYYKDILEELRECKIEGEKANDLIRGILPIGVKTKLRIGFTIEALIHFMHKRLCSRADEPIRRVATLMKKEVLNVEPRYKHLLVPQCVELMFCPEKHSCGIRPSRESVEKLLRGEMNE